MLLTAVHVEICNWDLADSAVDWGSWQKMKAWTIKKLNWHKNNIENSSLKLEEYFSKADLSDDNTMILYGILKGLILSMSFVLDEMHKGEKNGEQGNSSRG